MAHLLSKLIAGGLSAAVILLWWPLVFPSDSLESWLVRGIVWTASFELMLHAFMPMEESLWRSRAARRVRDKAARAGGRIAADSPERAMRWRTGVACVALTVPLTLLATAPADPAGPKPAADQVRQVTEVKRIVRVETKRVKIPQQVASVSVPASQVVATRTASATAPAARRTPRRPAARSATPAVRNTAGKPPRAADPQTATGQQDSAAPQQPQATADAPK